MLNSWHLLLLQDERSMTTDPYASCPCGSGKKFKWCCEPIYKDIARAFEQESQGQHETARRLMAEVVARHPQNPEAWGRQAQLLAALGKLDEAEEALQKAFERNPNYPFGLLLRAQFRFGEGEIAGALLLARKAAEAYAPDARDFLGEVYTLIYQCEAKLHRPVAARAALRIVLHCDPGDDELRQHFEAQFGDKGRLPPAARRDYPLLPPAPTLAGDRRAAWDRALAGAGTPRLGELARIFDTLTQEDADDASAWFNLGLARAWLGDNRAALDALNRYLELEGGDARATTAATLMEVLRFGEGLEDECDYHEYSFAFRLSDGPALSQLLEHWREARRLVIPQEQQPGSLIVLVLEYSQTGIITAGSAPSDLARTAGYLAVVGEVVRVWGTDKDSVGRLREEIRGRLNLAVGEAEMRRLPAQFHEVVAEAIVFPTQAGDEGTRRVKEHVESYYEGAWTQKPRRSLSGNTPVDAVGYPVLRKKLRGVIQFIQDCAGNLLTTGYDFDRLRRKLGLLDGDVAPRLAQPGAEVSAMGAGELASLDAEMLSDEHLEQAFQAAQKADAADLAKRFGKTLMARQPKADKPDRYYLFSYLTQRALNEGEFDAALDYVNEGQSQDCTHNEGRRRNDYELRRGQVHARRGEADQAEDVFRRLIERTPSEMRFRTSAAEAMISLKQGARALRFAEEGLVEARKRNDRDSEGHLQELAAAAKKQMG
jgi:tetratricopeptide (TPR) repeat protein